MANFNFAVKIPKWTPTDNDVYSLWDYFGLPTGVIPKGDAKPNDLLKRAYNLIYNTYYRDENLQDEIDIKTSEKVLFSNVGKDYFTSAFKTRQRGPVTGLPVNTVINGSGSIPFSTSLYSHNGDLMGSFKSPYDSINRTSLNNNQINKLQSNLIYGAYDSNGDLKGLQVRLHGTDDSSYPRDIYTRFQGEYPENATLTDNVDNVVFDHSVTDVKASDIAARLTAGSTAIDIADWRLARAIQQWQERSLRGGVRYTEFLHSFFGVNPRDDRLQRPEYIGGSRSPVVTTEIIQSSSTVDDSPLGSGAGHMISADGNFIGRYHAVEYGYVIGITRIVPKIKYTNGIRRHWLRNSPFDFYFPNFAHLSEQGIYNEEVFAQDDDDENNLSIWGYQGIYNDMRFSPNHVAGGLRQSENGFLFWTMARKFDSLPHLNGNFISTEFMQDDFMRIFNIEDQEINRPCIVHVYNDVKFKRPMPFLAIPK